LQPLPALWRQDGFLGAPGLHGGIITGRSEIRARDFAYLQSVVAQGFCNEGIGSSR
jgi:hypothetical protein